ncbi:ferredoxin [Nocardia sp. 852002-20019_SCH5090214]|uniref:FAD-binding oxidoreductase n=1 Tax=Nocardia sp. 852002-20019_SCH5090214 TaxID=1834087 RepID=UPI0007EAEB31|nr:2Fe-2S iron-sulfur cluster binding domain-containing protein [Nocardia sp. 852002-20019_SCH5090214]OBA57832.1 ferredoxin [Nocardia sp. 852002-20019_SCH5090214]
MTMSPSEIRSTDRADTGTHCVRLRYTDTVKEIHVPEGISVLDAAGAAGVRLAHQCGIGTCGTCIGRISAGDVVMPEGRVYPLRADESAAGMRLLCQARARSDAEIDLDYPAALLDENPIITTATKVAGLTWLADSVVELQIRLPKSAKFSFRAGQYVRLRVPGTSEWRSYSMASGEREKRRLTFTVRVLPSGAMSHYLRERAAVGDELEMEGPMGSFGLRPEPGPILMVAGGTGLAPMLSMLDTLQTARDRDRIELVFGCTRGPDLFHLDELAGRRSFTPGLSVRVVVDEPFDHPDVLTGNPVSVLTAADVADPNTSAYLCGPPAMLDAARVRLSELGLPPERIHAEQFIPS